MKEKRQKLIGPVSAWLERLFVERQIILRSEGHTRYFVFSRRMQMMLASVAIGMVGYASFATAAYVYQSRIAMTKDASVERSQLAYRNLLDQVADYRESIVTITRDLREKQSYLRQLFEQNEALKQHLSSAETQLKQTETERRQVADGRSAMREQMRLLENEMRNISTQNSGLEKHMSSLRNKLMETEAAKADLDQTRSQQANTIVELRQRLAVANTRGDTLEKDMVSMRQDLQKAMTDRGEILGEKDKLVSTIQTLESQMALMQVQHHEALRRFAERTAERIAFAEDLIAKTGVPVFDLLPGPPPPPPPPRQLITSGNAPKGGPFVPVIQEEQGGLLARFTPTARDTLKAATLDQATATVDAQISRWAVVQAILASMPFAAPLDDYALSSGFGGRHDPFNGRLARHEGLDFTSAYKAEVVSTAPGKVTYAGWRAAYGRLVEIDHGNGISTRYAHLAKIDVKSGEKVDFGDVVGLLGSSGRSTGPHLHYEILLNGRPYDPLKFIRAGQHVLKGE